MYLNVGNIKCQEVIQIEKEDEIKLTSLRNILVTITIILVTGIALGIVILKHRDSSFEDMNYVTNEGNTIYTEYQDFGEFYIKVPKDFEIMNTSQLKEKYQTQNSPKIAYTNDEGSINIAFNNGKYSLNGRTLNDYIESIKIALNKLGYFYYYFPLEVNGNDIHTFSFYTQAEDTMIYNYIAIFSIDNELMLLNFNCIKDYEAEWQGFGEYIINSIKIK